MKNLRLRHNLRNVNLIDISRSGSGVISRARRVSFLSLFVVWRQLQLLLAPISAGSPRSSLTTLLAGKSLSVVVVVVVEFRHL